MTPSQPLSILCLASYPAAGARFLKTCKRAGCTVLLLITEKVATADWPREAIDELRVVPGASFTDAMADTIQFVEELARTTRIDRVVALDEFDIEPAALVRAHLSLPGMEESHARLFRDKLAMRLRAKEADLLIPPFVHALNRQSICDFFQAVPGPWLLKPRSLAGAHGIKRINAPDEVWPLLDALGDKRSAYLIEKTIPGEIFHVDALIAERRIALAEAHKVRHILLRVREEGGIFATRTLPRGSAVERELLDAHAAVFAAFGLDRGVTHTEFILGQDDGRFYFLETAARPSGAYVPELIEAATGVNLWEEWAKIELAAGREPYAVSRRRADYAGSIISPLRELDTDLSEYSAPEVVLRMTAELNAKPWAVFVLSSPTQERVEQLMDQYEKRIWDRCAPTPTPQPGSVNSERRRAVLCMAGYPSIGPRFLRACKKQGCAVFLLTVAGAASAEWPRESIDEILSVDSPSFSAAPELVLKAVDELARRHTIDIVAALDEFDLEAAALVREHLRIPGLGQTRTRRVRDKLAMRIHARERGIRIPPFLSTFHHESIRQFLQEVPGPWLLKPRGNAGGRGIKRIPTPEAVWPLLQELGAQQTSYLIEKTLYGDGYHVDALMNDGEIVFVEAHRVRRHLLTLNEVPGVFGTRTLPRGSQEEQELLAAHAAVIKAFGYERGVSHTEFMRSEADGRFYFLETAARPAGARITELVEASTGINLWEEWAKIELSTENERYRIPARRTDYGGVVITEAREAPDVSAYNAPEVVGLFTPQHFGKHFVSLVLQGQSFERIEALMDHYEGRVWQDFGSRTQSE